MHFLSFCLCITGLSLSCLTYAEGTDLDQYLIKNDILDSQFKIKDKTRLNELLHAMTMEDSRTLPYQVDQNMLMEKMDSTADYINIQGAITTVDFEQFEQDVGLTEVNKLIRNNALQNCHLLFEHQFQRTNPYVIYLNLASTDQRYTISIKNTDCRFS